MSVGRPRIALVMAGGPAPAWTGRPGPFPKALLPVAGTPLVARAIAALREAGCARILVLHDAGDPVAAALDGVPGVECVPRSGREQEYAAGIRFGLASVAERIPTETLREASVLAVACDLALAGSDDFGTLLSAFEASELEVAMGLGDAATTTSRLPGRKLSVIRLAGSPDTVVQTVVLLRGSLLRHGTSGFRFKDWPPAETDRVEELLRAARERRRTPWIIPLLVYREVMRRIDSPASFLRLLGAVARFAMGRLDARTATALVTELSGVRFGVLRNDRWRLSFDVDSAADLQFAEAWLAAGPSPA